MNTCFEDALPDIFLELDTVLDSEDLFLFQLDHFHIDSDEDIFAVEKEHLEQSCRDLKRTVVKSK